MSRRWMARAGAAVLIAAAGAAHAKEPVNVVVTIQPVHSLVAGVMEGIGKPTLLISGGGSPHTYSLRPSEARALNQADVVVRVSERLETFLNRPIETLADSARVLTLEEAEGVVRLDVREGGAWDVHDHGHGHDDHAHGHGHGHGDSGGHGHRHEAGHDHGHDHAHARKDDHGHGHGDGHGHRHDHDRKDEHASGHGHGHDHGDSRGHGHRHETGHEHGHDHPREDHHHHDGHDTHFWLDPMNAKAFVAAIADALAGADPERADAYHANAERVAARLDELHEELTEATKPLAGKPYIVFHDAYQYFEARYGLSPAGSITVSPDRQPGAKRLSELRERIRSLEATCVFSEPQFEPRLVGTVTEGTRARAGVLDPLGAAIAPGPDLYFELMRQLSGSLTECLGA